MSTSEIQTRELLDPQYLKDKSIKKVSLATLKRRKQMNESPQKTETHQSQKGRTNEKHRSIMELKAQFL